MKKLKFTMHLPAVELLENVSRKQLPSLYKMLKQQIIKHVEARMINRRADLLVLKCKLKKPDMSTDYQGIVSTIVLTRRDSLMATVLFQSYRQNKLTKN